ncbi:hypothetical protein ACFSTE_13935 [Aquimarina hainanensis]|uniref:Uncharacterized protein n=1 Tax=Aquimarina hainanensis TaxID=1578017 RepID=A0ABW5NBH5_9FLAO
MINQKVIAATLCVQKEAPKGCNGKCQLRKMLRANSKKTPSGIPMGQEENYVVSLRYLPPAPMYFLNTISIKTSALISCQTLEKPIKQFYEIEVPPPITV